jgi:N-acetylglucosamine kinase-like BadF-type ATPase
MIVIADSGSTKTEWAFIASPKKTPIRLKTIGLNPLFIDSATIVSTLSDDFSEIETKNIKKVYFFGASCSSQERCAVIQKGLQPVFPNADISTNHDMLGAAVGLFGQQRGLAVILGTGSNSALYNGKTITKNIPALGYILGDEGSGAYFGLQLVKSFLNNTMPFDLQKQFEETYHFDKDTIFDSVYSKPFPNRYLAGFAPFLSTHRTHSFVHEMLLNGFDDFFKLHILPYEDFSDYPLGSIGSIGFYFSEELQEVAHRYNCRFEKILQSPMEGLLFQLNK